MEIKEEYKPYLYGGACLLATVYCFAYLLLALLTSINDMAGYPIYNFLGSNIDLRPAVLKLLPAENPVYLPKWNSLPFVNFLFSTLVFTILVVMNFRFISRIKKDGSIKFAGFLIITVLITTLIFGGIYSEIIIFVEALANTAK